MNTKKDPVVTPGLSGIVMTNITPIAPGTPGWSPLPVDWTQVDRFVDCLGKARSECVVSLFPPAVARGEKPAFNMPPRKVWPSTEVRLSLRKNQDYGVGMVVNNRLPYPEDWAQRKEAYTERGNLRVWGASGAHIGGCPALFQEGDSGLPIEEQLQAPARAGLPVPGFAVATTNRSVHLYWPFPIAIEPDRWQQLMLRLLVTLKGAVPENGWDSSLTSLARVMRVPGSTHPKTGETVHFVEGYGSGEPTPVEVWDRILKPLPTYGHCQPKFLISAGAVGEGEKRGWFDRMKPEDQVDMAIKFLRVIPPRLEPGSGTRAPAVKTLCALVHHFGTELAVAIAEEAGWCNEFWDPGAEASRIGQHIQPAGMGWVIKRARAFGWKHPGTEFKINFLRKHSA